MKMINRVNPHQNSIAACVLILVFFAAAFSPLPLYAWVKVGAAAPPFSLKDLQGKTHSLAGGKAAQITILYFFDVDSQSSREGIIKLALMATKHRSALRVLAISGSSREKLARFDRETDIPFPLLYDDGKVRSLYNAKMILPVVCAVDSGRMVLDYHQGGGMTLQTKLGQLSDRVTQAGKTASLKGADEADAPKGRKPAVKPPAASGEAAGRDLPRLRARQELLQPPPVSIVTSKNIYRNGDLISLKISTSQDNYLSLFHVAADDSVTMLIPNQLQQVYFLNSADPLIFPFEGIELRASSTPGKKKETETFLAVATIEPFDFEKQLPRNKALNRKDLLKAIAKIPERERSVTTTTYDIIE
jgi:peroxiredoxin